MEQQEYAQRGYLREDFRLFHLKGAMEEQLDWHYHTFHKLIFFLGGQSGYGVEGRSYPLEPGDVILGLPSSGVHSNGFSLVRKALFEQAGYTVDTQLDELGGEKLGDVLLTPTKIYVKTLSPLFKAGVVKGVAHITGGGFIENIPRMIPDGLAAHINLGSWPVLPIFDVLEKAGEIDHMEMFNIFNMGIGMVLAVSAEDADKTMELLKSNGEAGYVLGNIVKKTGEDVELQ